MVPNILAVRTYPNEAGFETALEVRRPVLLPVTGRIPKYVEGDLYRTGPGRYNLPTSRQKDFNMAHWFDGFTLNHRFEIKHGAVSYSSKYACDELMENVSKTGNMGAVFSFAQPRDPCESLFNKLSSVFSTPPTSSAPSNHNVGVTISHSTNGKLVVRTDANQLQILDDKTLIPENASTYSPKVKGQLSAAHGATDQATGEYFNYLLNLVTSRYTVFRERDGKTEVLAVIKSAKSAYIHSISLTQNYVILTVWQAYIPISLKVPWNKNVLDAIDKKFDSSIPTQFYVIPRNGGQTKLYESSQAFFCFHTINAYEQNDEIVLDLCQHANQDVLTDFYIKHLTSASSQVKFGNQKDHAKIARYYLPNLSAPSKATRTAKRDTSLDILSKANIELPIINPSYMTKKHRYIYGVHNQVSSLADSIVKIDTQSKEYKIWSDYPQAYSSPSEPIFIANPDSQDEDAGVLLTVVLDGVKRTSALVVLNARSLEVVARAQMDIPVPFGFHGMFAACNGNS